MAESIETCGNFRNTLPCKMMPRNEVSVLGLLKNCIGKDLSKITMPVALNEPLSFLQRLSEYMEYSQLLTLAAQQKLPAERMKYVAAFAVSALASNWERLGKPFNPLLGETYELQRNDYKVICEQVSHHPPISAFHAESPDFKFHGSISPKLKFWGKSVEILPQGTVVVELLKWGEIYTWNNVNCCVHNIIIGKLWIEQHGTMEIINHNTNHKAVLNFKESRLNPKHLHRVEGFIEDKNREKLFFLYGNWTTFLKTVPIKAFEEYSERCGAVERKINNHPEASSKKVFSKLSSLKMNSFRSLSIQEDMSGKSSDINGDLSNEDNDNYNEIPGSSELWKCLCRPEYSSEYYHFTNFALSLNEIEKKMILPKSLCPTDSRLRPDIRYLENGDTNSASMEKSRLEEKQRHTQKQRKFRWTPRWFEASINPYTKTDDWVYKGGYWERDYTSVENIF